MSVVLLAACESAPVDPDMAAGREVFATCAACHGKDGTGGVGPALSSVHDTFPDCETQVRWIRLGSEGWKQEVGSTYGVQEKPIESVMPGFGSLTDEQVRQVAMYERTRFGGGELETERAACGLG